MSKERSRPVQISEIVAAVLGKEESAPSRSRARAAMKVFDAFRRIGPPVSEQAEPARFDRGVLSLTVGQSAWMTELGFLKAQLIDRLNLSLGRPMVKDLRFRLGRVERPANKGIDRRPLTEIERAKVTVWTESIGDEALRAAVARAAERAIAAGLPTRVPPPGPPGPRATPPSPPKEEAPEQTYGYGHRVIDKFKGVDHWKK